MKLTNMLRNLFKTEESRFQEEKILSFEEALLLFNSGCESLSAEKLNQALGLSEKIFSEFRIMEETLSALKLQKLDEKYRSSEAIKNQFCEKFIARTQKLEMPEKDNHDIRSFADSAGMLAADTGITPKQAMHLKFFFESEMKGISEKIRRIDALLAEMKGVLNSEIFLAKESIGRSLDKIMSSTQYAEISRKKLKNLESDITGLEKLKMKNQETLRRFDGSELQLHLANINALEEEKSRHQQRIISEIGSVSRLLKKYMHQKNLQDKLLNTYISDPAGAIHEDKHLQIKQHLSSAVQIADELGVERRHVERAQALLKNFDSLAESRDAIASIGRQIAQKEDYISKAVTPRIRQKEAAEDELVALGKKLESAMAEKYDTEKQLVHTQSEVQKLQAYVIERISSALSMKIKLTSES
ncbi:MAG: hypothetical protein HYY37_00315 [Candidatus Aenigmarchaeota archaeon]|nr:hypothetical protein [Candidatus Aenigmarchaeota archaeon]